MESQSHIPADALDIELEELLQEAEATVSELRRELDRRRQAARDNTTAAQHAEIARLSAHLENARVNWADVKEFFNVMITELKKDEKR